MDTAFRYVSSVSDAGISVADGTCVSPINTGITGIPSQSGLKLHTDEIIGVVNSSLA